MAEATLQKPAFQAVELPSVQQTNLVLSSIQEKRVKAGEPPLDGINAALEIGKQVPPKPGENQQYRICEIKDCLPGGNPDPNKSVIVTSPDGSVEDAIRVYNSRPPEPNKKNEIRTIRQLKIEAVLPLVKPSKVA